MSSKNNLQRLCDVEDSCLVIIDVQEKLTAAIPPKVINRLRKNTNILLSAANELGIPVITTAQYPKGLGAIETIITDNVTPETVNFEKTSFSCLGAEGFREHLSALGKKQLILIGIEAHICVFQTALELMTEGFEVYVVLDAIASREFTSYESALLRLKQIDANLLNAESVIFEWLRDATDSKFKILTQLITN